MSENWKLSKEGLLVSSMGAIKNKKGVLIENNPKYPRRIRIAGKSIARIVYETFVGEVPENCCVCYRGNNKNDNSLENLICVSVSEKIKNYSQKKESWVDRNAFIERAVLCHGEKYDYSECIYKRINAKVLNIKCRTHGLFSQIGSDHTSGKGCPECGKEKNRKWTQEQDEYLIINYNSLGATICAENLCKSKSAVSARAFSLGICKKINARHENIPAHIFTGILSRVNSRNDERGELDFDKDFIWELYLKQYKKCALTNWCIDFSDDPIENTVSIDRIDSSKGYLKTNVQLVHKDVNRMKNAFSDEYFYQVCEAVVNNKIK